VGIWTGLGGGGRDRERGGTLVRGGMNFGVA